MWTLGTVRYLEERGGVSNVLCLNSIGGVALQKEVKIVEKKRRKNIILAVMAVSHFS